MAGRRPELDAMLHLMDRQVVDDDGLMVCKVDDLEVHEQPSGRLVVTAVLCGAPAWTPRISQWLGERWRLLGVVQDDRRRCFRIGLEQVTEVSSEVRLGAHREHLLRRQTPEEIRTSRRLGDLAGAEVVGEDSARLGHVLDVRLGGLTEGGVIEHELPVTGLVVGPGRPGGLLGYDRRAEQGPWVVNKLVRRLHRRSGMVGVDRIVSVDWEDRVVAVRGGLDPLEPAGTPGRPLRDR